METFTVTVDNSGRILLPSKIRKQLKLTQGSKLVACVSDEKLVLETRLQALREVQAYFSKFRPKSGKLVSEELIEERRKEARRELED